MPKGGKREGAGRKPRYGEPMASMELRAPDSVFELLARLGQGNYSEGLRQLADIHWRNDLVVHQMDAGEMLVKQVTISHVPAHLSGNDPISAAYRVDVIMTDDRTVESFATEAEARDYAQDVMGRGLKPLRFETILEHR